jgi:hexosaminidase
MCGLSLLVLFMGGRPHLAAVSTRSWWSGATDWADFRSRLEDHTARLDALGVRYRPLT